MPLKHGGGGALKINRRQTENWKPLRFLNLYRLGLSLFAVLLCITDTLPSVLGSHNLAFFYKTCIFYLLFSVGSIFTILSRKPGYSIQVFSQVLIDILVITLLMHASGGVRSGLGMLLIVAIAGSSLLAAGRTAIFFAATASLAVLVEQLYSSLEGIFPVENYTQSGLLGISFFATAILAHVLAMRLRESEALAERRGVDLENMAQLTQYVIQRMQTGILVVDNSQRIHLMNESAQQLLDTGTVDPGNSIEKISPLLARQLNLWWDNPEQEPHIFHPAESAPEVLPKFARLGKDRSSGTLIFLEDTSALSQQAQQMKLASLGRLTASIAHEIRNPLAAISHAGQLLAESKHLDNSEARLTEIIRDHTRRVNTIIENIMQLSRRDRAKPEEFLLKPWAVQFVTDFARHESVSPDAISVDIQPADTMVRMDPNQLHQVVWNLCKNGLRHSTASGNPHIDLQGGLKADSATPYLDIIDYGPGISPEVAEHIFEPFFTTEAKGIGLGLYISRELCESNQARLNYLTSPPGIGGCFRISFADPRRKQVT